MVRDKSKALRHRGCRNPRSQDVDDPRFADDVFFDAEDLVQVKYEMLRRVEVDGDPVKTAAKQFGFSRTTYYQTQEQFESAGLAGLVPQKRGPRGGHKLNDKVVDFLVEQLAEDPSLRPDDLVRQLQDHFNIRVHRRSIERALERRKKTPVEKIAQRRPDRGLIDGYEQLRRGVVKGDQWLANRHGLGVFLQHGMAAWMKVYELIKVEPIPVVTESIFRRAPAAHADEVTTLLADIILQRQGAICR